VIVNFSDNEVFPVYKYHAPYRDGKLRDSILYKEKGSYLKQTIKHLLPAYFLPEILAES